MIFNEYHFGAWRDNAKKLFEMDNEDEDYDFDMEKYKKDEADNAYNETFLPITTSYYLFLSGTPFRAINSGEFIEDQIYNWTYSDEQRAKENWDGAADNPYAALPRMVMMTYRIPDSIRQIAMQGQFGEFDLNVFFSAKYGEKSKPETARFVYENEVQKWLDLIRGSYLPASMDDMKLGQDKRPPTVPLATAIAEIQGEYHAALERLQNGNFASILIVGQAPDWREVVAVFASKTAGAEDGMDVFTLDAERVALLRQVFWDMCKITTVTQTVDVDDSHTGIALTITITAKTAEQMRLEYSFSKYQNDALDILLENLGSLNIPTGSLTISQEDAIALLENLPDNLDPGRKAVVETAVQLVGRVSYFWGGKSLTLGWDDRWGVPTEVTAAGSGSTGTIRPFGLDCSGFVDWTFYNATNGSYYPGRGGGAATQHSYCTNISWNDAQPGDLVFYPDDSHVGIVGGKDADGNFLIVHCSGGANGVVITGSAGFTTVARPDCF